MALNGISRLLPLFALTIALPALGQSVDSAVRWDGIALKPAILLAAADTGAEQGTASQAPAETAPADSYLGARGSSGLFGGSDSSGSPGQQSATAGYELRGTSAAGFPGSASPLTETGRGAPIVFENGIAVRPSLLFGVLHNDNLLSSPSSVPAVSSTGYNMVAGAVAEITTPAGRYSLNYSGNFARYTSSSADNYNHNNLSLGGDNTFAFTNRVRVGWNAVLNQGSDPRGSTDRPLSTGPDLWHSSTVNGLFSYGAAQATGRLELAASLGEKRYTSNRLYTAAADTDTTGLGGRFLYRVMPKTTMVFEIQNTHVAYIDDVYSLDNTTRQYNVGVTWLATAATTGSFMVGGTTKRFSASNQPDYSGATWTGTIRWSPLTYSIVDIVTSKSTADSTGGLGSYTVNTNFNVAWNHNWTSYISSRVAVGQLTSDYVGFNRKDDSKIYDLGYFYALSRRLRAGLDWTLTDRSSTPNPLFAFKRNVVMLSIEGTL